MKTLYTVNVYKNIKTDIIEEYGNGVRDMVVMPLLLKKFWKRLVLGGRDLFS